MAEPTYEVLVAEAMERPVEGWDFSSLDHRIQERPTSWSYDDLARRALADADTALDLGTGGGEVLSRLSPLPPRTVATEGWAPNVDVARRRLEPLGVEVVDVTADPAVLPMADESVDVVLSRHEAYDLDEVFRVLRPGGTFVTQQVGGRDLETLNQVLGALPHRYAELDLARTVADAVDHGFTIVESGEEFPAVTFADVGVAVMHLNITPWQIEGFSPGAYDSSLRALHERIRADGGFNAQMHRFYLVARCP